MRSTIPRVLVALALCSCGGSAADLPASASLTLAQPAYVEITLSARVAGASFRQAGAESATALVRVDGEADSHVVLYGGGEETLYRALSTRRLAPGAHEVRVELDAGKSRAAGAQVHVTRLALAASPDAQVARAPILIGRDGLDNARTDVPLGMYAEREAGGTRYTVIWSNEDGGTGVLPSLLLSGYGRVVDIEWVYQIADGAAPPAGKIQGAGHGTEPFAGTAVGERPVLLTATSNNNMQSWQRPLAPQDPQVLVFSLPLEPPPAGGLRELLLDRHPAWVRASNDELQREHGLKDAPGLAAPGVADLREHFYVDYEGRDLPEGRVILLDDAGRRAASDRGVAIGRVSGSRLRTAIERAAPGARFAALELETVGGAGPPDPAAAFRVFTLDGAFAPVEVARVPAGQVKVAPLR